MSDTKTFADFGLHDDLCQALGDAGISAPFPIQEMTLPLGLSGADVIGQARTGMGKTLAFGLPLLQRLDERRDDTQALVIVPTRELCVQVREDLARASARRGTRVVAAYGGKAIEAQITAIADGAPVVVGTPGRLLDLLRRGALDLSTVTSLVLDEADEMLDLGFLPDVERLIEATAEQRQTQLFSATMPSAVVALARRYMHKPTFLRAEVEEARIAPDTQQHFFACHRMDKPAVLARILQTPKRGLCVVFTRTKRMADVLASELGDHGIAAAPIHSDLRQDARERALSRFREGKTDVLVATEVAARGLDIDDVTHVVNYDCPDDEKMYLHRIGRTGRAGAAGVAITLALWNEQARLEMIKKALDVDAPTHEVFSTSPILDELFDLPERAPRRTPSPAKPSGSGRKSGSSGKKSSSRKAKSPDKAGSSRKTESTGKDTSSRKDAPAAPADEATPADQSAPAARVRTRTRRRKSTEQSPAGEQDTAAKPETPAREEPAAAEAPAERKSTDTATEGRRRVRTRTRSGPAEPGTAPADATTPGEAQQPAPRRRTRTKRQEVGRQRRRGGGEQQDERRREHAAPAQPAREEASEPTAPAPRQDRERATPAPNGNGSAAKASNERPSAETLRGGGKPGLRRPMTLTHLP